MKLTPVFLVKLCFTPPRPLLTMPIGAEFQPNRHGACDFSPPRLPKLYI